MPENRISPRFRSLAHVQIIGIAEGECLLKNLSITGCCIECTGITDIKPNTQYQLEIKPEAVSHIRHFELQVESRWVRGNGYSTEVGLCIIASPRGKQFQRYVDYLAYRHNHH